MDETLLNENTEAGRCGPMVVIRQLPGRIRVRSGVLKSCWQAVEEKSAMLSEISGIHKVKLNHQTSSMLVTFDESQLDAKDVFRLINKMDIFDGVLLLPRNYDEASIDNSAQENQENRFANLAGSLVSGAAKILLVCALEQAGGKVARSLVGRFI